MLTAAVLLAAVLLASCENGLVPKPAAPAENAEDAGTAGGSILVSITFPDAESGARTAMPVTPSYDELNWSVSATYGTQTVQAQGAYPTLTMSLPYEGTWTFTAQGAADDGRQILYGQTIREITHENAVVTIVPGPGQALQGGKGSIDLAIQAAPDTNIAAVHYKLEPTGSTTGGGSLNIEPLTGSGSGWTFSEPDIGAGTYLLYLYFTEHIANRAAKKTVYVTAEAVNVWNGMTTSRWVNTGGTRYLTDSGEFILTQDIIDTFIASVGETVYVSADGSDEQDGIGSVIAPVQTFSRAMELLSANDTRTANGTVAVMGEVSAGETMLSSGADITVQGASGGGALVNTSGRVFTVEAGASLTLGAGITLTGTNTADTGGDGMGGAVYVNGGELTMQSGSAITGSSGDGYGGAVYVSGGTLTMESGSAICNSSAGEGGAVYVADGGKFTMNGGSIYNNTASTPAGIYSSGGGVYVANGNSMFTMNNGEITDNTANGSALDGGGAVYVENGTASIASGVFVMNNGTISKNNVAGGSGGGVYANGTFIMNGGVIGGTDTSNANNAPNGGGVSVPGEFTMTGGTISGNTARYDGGGVYVFNGTFTMSSGKISGNTAGNGGGVCVFNGTFTGIVDAAAAVTGNTPDDIYPADAYQKQ